MFGSHCEVKFLAHEADGFIIFPTAANLEGMYVRHGNNSKEANQAGKTTCPGSNLH